MSIEEREIYAFEAVRVAVWKVVGGLPDGIPIGIPVGIGPEPEGGACPDFGALGKPLAPEAARRVGRTPLGRRVRLGIGMVTASALNPLRAPDSCAGGVPDGIGPLIMC